MNQTEAANEEVLEADNLVNSLNLAWKHFCIQLVERNDRPLGILGKNGCVSQ